MFKIELMHKEISNPLQGRVKITSKESKKTSARVKKQVEIRSKNKTY